MERIGYQMDAWLWDQTYLGISSLATENDRDMVYSNLFHT